MRNAAVLLVFFLVACGGSGKPPQAPLDRAKFEQVLTGALLIEARVSREMQVDKRTGIPVEAYYAELFKQEGVTQADFKATYKAYAAQPEALKAVYQEALNSLQQRADSLGNRH